MKQKQEKMGFWWIAAALIFFFNPNINIIDPLPDFVGYLLLCIGLSKLADLNETIDQAVNGFRKMILIDAGKWLALVWVFGLSVTSERNSSLLLWTFVFSVLELIFLLPAYAKLFEGISQLGYFYPNRAIFGTKAGKKTPTDKMRIWTVIFVVLKATLTVLPEFADLSNASYDESSGLVNLYRYIGIMRFLAMVPVLLLGLVWLIRAELYFRRLRKDGELVRALSDDYATKIRPKTGIFVRRSFQMAYILLLAAVFLTVDFRLEYRNVLPDFLAAGLLFGVLILLRRHTKFPMLPWILTNCVYLGVTVVTAVAEWRFFDRFYYGAIYKSEEAMVSYTVLTVCTVVQALTFLLLLWFVIRSLHRVIEAHTGYVQGQVTVGESEAKMVHSLQKEEKISLLYAFLAAVLYGISDVCHVFLAPTVGFMGVIHFAVFAVFIGFFWKAMASIRTAVQTKYMLE